MTEFRQMFNPLRWDRVFGHPIGQTPSWGIPPEVFVSWWEEREAERARLNNESRKRETERRRQATVWKRRETARIRSERAHRIPYGGWVRKSGEQFMAVVKSADGERHEFRGSQLECPKWLLYKCRELGLTERGPEPPQYTPQEVIDFVLAHRGLRTRYIATKAGIDDRLVRKILQCDGEMYAWQHYDRQRKREIAAMAFKHDYADMTIPQLQIKYGLSRNMICSASKELNAAKSESYKARRLATLRETMRTLVQPANINAGARRRQLWNDERAREQLGLKRLTRFKVNGRPVRVVKTMCRLVATYDYVRTEDVWTLRRCGPHLPKNEKRYERIYNIQFID